MKTGLTLGLLLLVFLWYLSFSATRLDRLHHRVETSWANLDGLLQRRAAVALELAHSELADPASSLILMAAAYQAREADMRGRSFAESGLSSALKLLHGDLEGQSPSAEKALLEELSLLTEKIKVGVAIHVDAVARTISVRKKIVFKFFRLAGTAPLPITHEFEDDDL